MGQQTDLVRQTAIEMDEQLASVMPDDWIGHARLVLNQKDLSDEQRDYALNLVDKYFNEGSASKPASKVASVAAKKAIEKFS